MTSLLSGLLFVGSILFYSRVFSYNDTITHPAITNNIVNVYNENFDLKLSEQEKEWVKQGSIAEDTPTRWMNHFYHPVSGRGLFGYLSSKDWAQNSFFQSMEFGGNQTWEKALDSYVKGDKRSAFFALGHVLHLIEDATVPAHTKLDIHPTGDPYEGWVEENIGNNIHFNVEPVSIVDLKSAFDNVAYFSSSHFLSKDTIEKNEVSKIDRFYKKINENEEIECLRGFVDNKMFCLLRVKTISKNDEYFFDNFVHSDYFSLLVPKAVSYGAGVIDLFFREAEKKKLEQSEKSWWNDLWSGIGAFFGFGEGIDEDQAGDSSPLPSSIATPQGIPPSLPPPSPSPTPVESVIAQPKVELPGDAVKVAGKDSTGGPISETISPDGREIPSEISDEDSDRDGLSPIISPAPTPPSFIPGIGGLPIEGQDVDDEDDEEDEISADLTAPQTVIDSGPPLISTSTMAIFIFSSSEASSTFECQLDGATSTVCVSPQLYSGLSAGDHNFKVKAIDEAGNADQTPAEYSWSINFPPSVSLSLTDYDLMKMDFNVNWTSSSTNVANYDVQYRIGVDPAWQDWAIATTTTTKNFQAVFDDNNNYYFRARANDSAGQAGDWQEIQAAISAKPVVFNEVMFNPAPGSDDYYEYIEIYNRSPVSLDLADWKLINNGQEFILSADVAHGGASTILPSGGFALITDESNSSSPSIYDNVYYQIPIYSSSHLRLRVNSAAMNLRNDPGSLLVLKNGNNRIIDQVSYIYYWGADGNGKSLERINPNSFYADRDGWQESAVGGTPNAANSCLDLSAGTVVHPTLQIFSDTLWTKGGSPYRLYSSGGAGGDSPSVAPGVTLTIGPGVVLNPVGKAYNSLYVQGTLRALGTAEEPIVFTSMEAEPQAGDWGTAIRFAPESINSVLSYVDFQYGGYYQTGIYDPIMPLVVVNESAVSFNNCRFMDSQTRALDLINSSSEVRDSFFVRNAIEALRTYGSSTAIIAGNVFANTEFKGAAISVTYQARPVVTANSFTGFQKAVLVKSAYPELSDLGMVDNSYNGIFIDENSEVLEDTVWRSEFVYLVQPGLGIGTGATLTIEAGTVVKLWNSSNANLWVNGSLVVDGHSSSTLINFTSIKDDAFGGDSNNDGSATSPDSTVGEWHSIVLAPGSNSVIKYANFHYGGYRPFEPGRDRLKSFDVREGANYEMEYVAIY